MKWQLTTIQSMWKITWHTSGAGSYMVLKAKKKNIAASHKLRPLAANASLCFEASHARLCRMAQPTQRIPHLPICISQRAFASSQPECAAWALFNKVIPFYVVSEEDVTMGQVTATKSAVPRFCRHKQDPVPAGCIIQSRLALWMNNRPVEVKPGFKTMTVIDFVRPESLCVFAVCSLQGPMCNIHMDIATWGWIESTACTHTLG